ncbi:MAG: tRNA uridine-5-carboxymethylaminomethyl(34) synthesis enzyme MnmG [Planctomycetota bacterium]
MSSGFEIIVVGGGHAGCEAALVGARMGFRTALVTLRAATIGALSCNPAVGGIGKGQLVREIDALGGQMARVTDATAIQYRMLNTSKGEAVRALRAQVDKDDYSSEMQRVIASTAGLTVIEGAVEDLVVRDGRVAGVVLADGSSIAAQRVILTNGTFLRGLMHTGEAKRTGGRIGEAAVQGLSGALERLGFERGRLKTGTPPRLAAESIDWSQTTAQPGDVDPEGFSHYLPPPRRAWVSCYVTRTNERAHDAIRANLHRSPLYAGAIEGIGPRYCPSIEDKVVRFPDRVAHTVHLEPEGLRTNSIYVNGVSTSLPADVQEEVIRAIPGLAAAVFLRHGYAVEYDFFPAHQIARTFESRPVPGLYLAGQICGTSGYEEAAAQGFLAGVNAALSLRDAEPFVLGREQAYLGVLADDLVRTDPREPYRMFTSRAEYRLLLRHDNADVRLAQRGVQLGLVDPSAAARVDAKQARVEETLAYLSDRRVGPTRLLHLLRRPEARFDDILQHAPELAGWELSAEVREQVLIRARYEKYIERQLDMAARLERHEAWGIPQQFSFAGVHGLRREAVEKLERYRPRTLGQASRIAGVTPADLSLIMVSLRVHEHDE